MPENLLSPELITQLTGYAIQVVGALVGLFIANLVSSWLAGAVTKRLTQAKFDVTLTRFFGKLVRYAILTMAVLACLGIFGIETTSFAALIGAAGLAVGLAFQGTLGNFAAGIMLLTFRPFAVGQVITAAGTTGKVDEIGLFTTTLDTADNRRFVIPNGAVFGATIENISHHPHRRVDVAVGTDYGADVDETRRILETVIEALPYSVEGRAHQIFLAGLGASSVDWQVRVWCESAQYWDCHQATIVAVKKGLDGAGIGIPFPQMDVHLDPAAAA